MSFARKKTGVPVIVDLGSDALNILKDLPSEGVLFPYLSQVRAGDRATEFGQRCRQLGIEGVTLHGTVTLGLNMRRLLVTPNDSHRKLWDTRTGTWAGHIH